jgi:hypothetical protein
LTVLCPSGAQRPLCLGGVLHSDSFSLCPSLLTSFVGAWSTFW